MATAALIIPSLVIAYLAGEYAFFRDADDYAASTTTAGTVAIGGSTTDNIEIPGDADWFKGQAGFGRNLSLSPGGKRHWPRDLAISSIAASRQRGA